MACLHCCQVRRELLALALIAAACDRKSSSERKMIHVLLVERSRCATDGIAAE
jgi:hypothetical protein